MPATHDVNVLAGGVGPSRVHQQDGSAVCRTCCKLCGLAIVAAGVAVSRGGEEQGALPVWVVP